MNKITVIDLAKVVPFAEVQKSIKYHYPDDENNYTKVYDRIKKMRKSKKDYEGEEIVVDNKKLDDQSIKDIYELDDYYNIATNKYSMSFRSWYELSNMPISKETLDHYTFKDILAHFIWEITYYGNEQEMRKTAKEVIGRAAELNKKYKLK